MTSEHSHCEVAEGIARVVIDRTDKRNAMSLDMWLGIPKLVPADEADAAGKTIILQGVDASAFAAGADIIQGPYGGRFVLGQRLVGMDLTNCFCVGRGSVREALNRLSAEGAAFLNLHRGAQIRSLVPCQ